MTARSAPLVVAVLLLGGCFGSDEDGAREKVEEARVAAEADADRVQKVIGLEGSVQRVWDACQSSPFDAVALSIGTRVEGRQMPTIELMRDRLVAAGWKVESDVDNEGLRSIALSEGGLRVGLTASMEDRRGGADWSIRGECVRVPRDLANELLAELP